MNKCVVTRLRERQPAGVNRRQGLLVFHALVVGGDVFLVDAKVFEKSDLRNRLALGIHRAGWRARRRWLLNGVRRSDGLGIRPNYLFLRFLTVQIFFEGVVRGGVGGRAIQSILARLLQQADLGAQRPDRLHLGEEVLGMRRFGRGGRVYAFGFLGGMCLGGFVFVELLLNHGALVAADAG